MPSPLYPLIEKFINDAWIKLDREQITPWCFMTTGALFTVKDFYGKQISYQGLAFEGSPLDVFWGGYIEPFLEDLTDQAVKETLRLVSEKHQDPILALRDSSEQLKSLARRAYARMADVDRRLRSNGYPEVIPLRSTEQVLASMDQLIDRRIAAELSMVRRRYRVDEFYKDHPFLFWFIALLVGSAITLLAGCHRP